MTATAERWLPAYVGIGSNLDGPAGRVAAAIEALRAHPGIRAFRASGLWCSAPVGTGPQPDYVNAVAGFLWPGTPPGLLDVLLELERRHGRTRDGVRWAPRRLDLDLLMVSDLVIDSPRLTLPHPRMTERAFVLRPLAEIAPELVVPGAGCVSGLLAGVSGQRIERMGAAA